MTQGDDSGNGAPVVGQGPLWWETLKLIFGAIWDKLRGKGIPKD